MKLKILSLGKTKDSHLLGFEHEICKRLRSPWKPEFIELSPVAFASRDIKQVLAEEARDVLKRVGCDDRLIALDESGVLLSSVEFSNELQSLSGNTRGSLCFLIGSPSGLDQSVRDRADLVLSLSKMTFPYQLARMLLVEQLYRAVSIMQGRKYHKE